MEPYERTTADPEICHGKSRIRATRIPVAVILDNLAAGLSTEEILAEHPTLQPEDIPSAMEVTTVTAHLHVNTKRLADFSERHRVSELAVFGSALREDFRPESDLDILITFLPNAEVSLFDLVDMADELSSIVGRPVDLVPKRGLKPQIRQPILESAHIL